MGIMKDALKKAGFKSSEPEKTPARLTKEKAKHGKKIHQHHNRTHCEACQKTAPDVERYDHPNRSVNANWLCVVCADHFKISDDYRKTAESDFSKRKMFQRNYGHTRRF